MYKRIESVGLLILGIFIVIPVVNAQQAPKDSRRITDIPHVADVRLGSTVDTSSSPSSTPSSTPIRTPSLPTRRVLDDTPVDALSFRVVDRQGNLISNAIVSVYLRVGSREVLISVTPTNDSGVAWVNFWADWNVSLSRADTRTKQAFSQVLNYWNQWIGLNGVPNSSTQMRSFWAAWSAESAKSSPASLRVKVSLPSGRNIVTSVTLASLLQRGLMIRSR